MYLTFLDVQQQVGSSDCGLYSLAFAYTLCNGRDLAKLEYYQVQFREHFLECLKNGVIDAFPHTVMKNPKKPFLGKFSVYFICLPNTGDSMVQCCDCKEWLHTLDWRKTLTYLNNGNTLKSTDYYYDIFGTNS